MKRLLIGTLWFGFVAIVSYQTPLFAQVPNPNLISAIAIYQASDTTSDDWPDEIVNYNITTADTIAALLGGIESDTLRDCSLLESKNSAYVYVKFNNSTRIVYHLFLRWTHFSMAGDRGNCFYVAPASQNMFKRHAQE